MSNFRRSLSFSQIRAILNITGDVSLWAQCAQGFRIPPMDDVNIGFTNFRGGYTSLANPDLSSERTNSVEFGWRQTIHNFSWSVSGYVNEYEDFIESLAVRGVNQETGLLEFQARNIDDVEIKGVDLSAMWTLLRQQIYL